MFRPGTVRTQLIGSLVLGLCGLGVGLASKHFTTSPAADHRESAEGFPAA